MMIIIIYMKPPFNRRMLPSTRQNWKLQRFPAKGSVAVLQVGIMIIMWLSTRLKGSIFNEDVVSIIIIIIIDHNANQNVAVHQVDMRIIIIIIEIRIIIM